MLPAIASAVIVSIPSQTGRALRQGVFSHHFHQSRVSIPSQTGRALRQGDTCNKRPKKVSQYLLKQVGRCAKGGALGSGGDVLVSIPSQTGRALRLSSSKKYTIFSCCCKGRSCPARKEISARRHSAEKLCWKFGILYPNFPSRTVIEKICRNKQKINKLYKNINLGAKGSRNSYHFFPRPYLHCHFSEGGRIHTTGKLFSWRLAGQRLRQKNIMAELSAATRVLFTGNNQDQISPVPRPVSLWAGPFWSCPVSSKSSQNRDNGACQRLRDAGQNGTGYHPMPVC